MMTAPLQAVQRMMVLVVNVFKILLFFALLLLYATWCMMWRLNMDFVSCKQLLKIVFLNMSDARETAILQLKKVNHSLHIVH